MDMEKPAIFKRAQKWVNFCLKYFMPTNIHTLQINNVHS